MAPTSIRIWTEVEDRKLSVATYFPHQHGGTLEYEKEWIQLPGAYAISPALPLHGGKQPLVSDRGHLPTALSDSAPDRWGRMLIQKQFARQGEQPTEVDYLLGVDDRLRLGALRFEVNGVTQSPSSRVPKLVNLADIERASRAVEEDDDAVDALKRIAVAGSSLGGARPKATVIDDEGKLMMAKFSSSADTIDAVAWEKVCLDIAELAGISTPSSRLLEINGRSVLLLERFDRAYGEDGSEARIPYMSAMTLLNRTDGDRASMVEIAEELRLLSINGDSAAELFSRTAINLLVGNTDNHLRNLGFIRVDGAWRLSPVFDITPATTKTNFATSVDVVGDDSVDTLMGAAGWFGLNDNQAIERLSRAVDAVKQWKELARRNQIAVAEDKQVAPSFDGGHLQRAQVLIREQRA